MKIKPIRTTYDAQSDAAYFYVVEEISSGDVYATDEIAPGIMADLDDGGRILGFEVLDARRRLAPGFFRKTPVAAE